MAFLLEYASLILDLARESYAFVESQASVCNPSEVFLLYAAGFQIMRTLSLDFA
jgi:hypothetical protein